MGTRHQIYIIAYVEGCYRVVAVFHRQSLYPPEAVQLAWALIQLIRKYAEPLAKELRCLKEYRYAGKTAEFPCPYLTSLPIEHIEEYSKYACPEGVINNDPWRQDNNSGFTVVNITDPFSPAYCFWGWNEHYGFPAGYPIDPENYALRYYVDPEDQKPFEDLDQEVQDAIRALEDESFIDSKYTLDEAWSNSVAELADYEADEEKLSQDAQEFIKDLQTVIQEGSTKAARKMADTLSPTRGVLDGLRITLHQESLPEHCNPIIVEFFLISQDLSRRKELDLSWKQLSPAQVVQVVQAVLQHDSYQITSLNLSGNSDVTVETLLEIFKLPKASEIKRLFLFGCPKVEDINRKDMPGRIGAGEGTEVFNSYLSYQY